MPPEPTVIARMQALIDAWEAAGDRRAIFLTCYAMMTRNMLAAIERGEFADAAWVSALLHRFAYYYFTAVDAFDSGASTCPGAWCVAFEAAPRPQTHVIQNLMLGVNAHINYDLVLALVDRLESEWGALSGEQRQARYHDHCHVNAIIAATINSVQDEVIERYSPGMDIVDKLFGPVDEWIIARLITDWREEVWHHAGELLACGSEADRAARTERIAQHVMKRAHAIAGKRGIAGVLDLV